ncbi:MAG: membrane protein insertase YidC, partial [Desulfosudaceae bacterium]
PETSPRKSLIAKENPAGTVVFDLAGADIPGLETGRYESDLPAADITVDEAPRTATFSRRTDSGVVVEKEYTFYPDSYLIGLDVVVKNDSDQAIAGQPAVTLNRYFVGEGSRFVFEGPCAYVNQRLKKVKIKDIPEESRVEGPLTWMAIENRYFMSSLIPETGMDGSMDLAATESRGNNLVTARHLGPSQTVPPQSIKTYHYNVFMGPKNINILKQIGFNLDKAVNFGWFDVVARPCLWLMNKVYQIIPNYGVAIIVLTLIIKLIFWPLGNKSYKSMAEMKKIQPLMAEVREKYKDDKKKMNEEMMALYKTYKVNPLGGCLPMIVQIPVFIAFYRMLYQAIELRHAPFMLWINDLSAPERLFSFDISVPLMQPPIGIPVMTIIMGATMFLQQKLQPTPGDPAQAKMMMLMPVFLTVIFINFPSGLVLYFIVNNLVSIAQQHYVTSRNN